MCNTKKVGLDIYAIAIVGLELKLQHISDDKTSPPESKESIFFYYYSWGSHFYH